MIKTTVNISDSGMDDILARAKKLKGRADIGVFGEADSEEVIIAGANEFGTDRAGKRHNIVIPQRSFIRSTLDEEGENISAAVDQAKTEIVLGKLDKKKFLNRLGLWFAGKVQAKILAGGTPFIENAESTKAAKIAQGRRDPKPLNDRGRLRQAIVHRVLP